MFRLSLFLLLFLRVDRRGVVGEVSTPFSVYIYLYKFLSLILICSVCKYIYETLEILQNCNIEIL